MGFMWNSCAVGNKYLFATVTYSSAWVSVLAFHQASQASGRWIEVENYGLRYQLFAAGVTVLLTVFAFGVMDFQSDPCFGDYNGGTVVNDTLMVSLVFSTTVWCAGCLGYTRLWLGVRLYSSRFILIYFACWMPQIVWFVFEVSRVVCSECGRARRRRGDGGSMEGSCFVVDLYHWACQMSTP